MPKASILLYNNDMGIFGFLNFNKKKNQHKPKVPYRLGLALSGGGAKGFAHIGVLRALEETNLDFDIVTGTSVGSLVGALYCAGVNSFQMEEFGKKLKTTDVLDKKLLITPSKSKNIESLLVGWIGEISFDKLSKKFACCATDIVSGEEIVLMEGSVPFAVSASCSAPIFFDGVDKDGMRLFDGGMTNNLPADLARRMGADIVVGVTLSNTGTEGTEKRNILSVAKASFAIISKSTSLKGVLNSDVLISPVLVGKKSSKLEGEQSIDEMILAGYNSAKEQIPHLLDLIGVKQKQLK